MPPDAEAIAGAKATSGAPVRTSRAHRVLRQSGDFTWQSGQPEGIIAQIKPELADDDETWLDLEKLAARIYSELEPGSLVRHDVNLPGSLSETPRQIDVLIENEALGTRVVVDCKDRSRRVDINAAAQFAGLLEDVGATRGVLICNRGFSKATRTYAKKKGFVLAGLHDVSSRRWQLDVLVPIVWARLRLTALEASFRVRLEAGDQLETNAAPHFRCGGADVDLKRFFEDAWNSGQLHMGRPGQGELSATMDLVLASGEVRPSAGVSLTYETAGEAGLGYVPAQDARGILDEQNKSFSTVHFDIGKTLDQEPEGGWEPVFDPHELAVTLAGTVITLEETSGVTVELRGLNSVVGADPTTRPFRWRRALQ